MAETVTQSAAQAPRAPHPPAWRRARRTRGGAGAVGGIRRLRRRRARPGRRAHLHHQPGACRYMAVPGTPFACAHGGLLVAVPALLGYVVTARARRRRGEGAPAALPRALAAPAVVAGFMVPVMVLVVTLTHTEAAETARKLGTPLCEG
ncbi:hypothetical protein [Streptomyces sp. NPDC101393]|uniref:hypothetical protein n=1 Tax=Streptomyces sp. NPDC101393 TaxID=3366141 RepID=UPI0037FEBF58